jgi:hypothetical protein
MPEKDIVLLWRCQVLNAEQERAWAWLHALFFLLAQAGWWLTEALG